MKSSGALRTHHLITSALGVALAGILGVVLILGERLAAATSEPAAALENAGALQTYPEALARALTSLRGRLETRADTAQAAADLRATNARFDHDLRQLAVAESGGAQELRAALLLWRQYAQVLSPVIAFSAQPYAESDAQGNSALSAAGSAHVADVKRAQLFARENAPRLQKLLAAAAAAAQAQVSASASRLRLLLIAGVLATLALAAVAAGLHIVRVRRERLAREVDEQTQDILQTVREGFFLLDVNDRIGAVWSGALTRVFGREDFAGVAFADLLEGLAPPATIATAAEYIRLLWGERAPEALRSVNPLAELEVQVDNRRGGRDTRYLQFDFHRVMGERGVKHLLVSVADATSSVLLARELVEAQNNANSQVDMLLGVMHIDPLHLSVFLDATEAGLQLVNAILKDPARSDGEFKMKLDGLLRELHAIESGAAALALTSVAQRAHGFGELLATLKMRAELSGGDFLPLVLKLDELLAHLRCVRELAARVAELRDAALADAPSTHALQGADGRAAPAGDDIEATLQGLAERLGREQRKRFRLSLRGLAHIPPRYRATVRDVLIQMVRNSAIHGIEPPDARRAHAKEEVGLVRAEFRANSDGYELVFEDDGAGLALEELKAAAIRRRITTAAEAAAMDTRTVMGLIFRAGVSTCERVTMDAGRGVGMDVVARAIAALGGKIVLSTDPGRFTRFKISIPAQAAQSAVA